MRKHRPIMWKPNWTRWFHILATHTNAHTHMPTHTHAHSHMPTYRHAELNHEFAKIVSSKLFLDAEYLHNHNLQILKAIEQHSKPVISVRMLQHNGSNPPFLETLENRIVD